MSNIRLFFPESLSLNFESKLDKSQSHYLTKVMRIKIGESFSLFNKNEEWLAKINQISKGIVEFSVIEKLRQKENTKEIWLAFSPIKSNYFNFMIQKATELGVTKFIPIIFDRTIVRKINKERLEKIIIEATEQSNRINVPILEKPQNLENFLTKNLKKIDLIFTDLNTSKKIRKVDNYIGMYSYPFYISHYLVALIYIFSIGYGGINNSFKLTSAALPFYFLLLIIFTFLLIHFIDYPIEAYRSHIKKKA